MMHTQHPGRVAMRRRGQEAREEQAHSAAGHDSAVPIRGGPGGAVREGGLHPREHGVQGIGCQHQASVSPAVIACGNAAVTFSRSVRRRTPEDPGPSCGPRSALLPSSSWRQQPFTGCESEIKTRADRPTRIDGTKPLWKAGQAIVGFAGVSVAHFGGDTTLLLWQALTVYFPTDAPPTPALTPARRCATVAREEPRRRRVWRNRQTLQ